MVGIVVKSDERQNNEACVLQQFGVDCKMASRGEREQAEYIAAKTCEAYAELKQMEGKQ